MHHFLFIFSMVDYVFTIYWFIIKVSFPLFNGHCTEWKSYIVHPRITNLISSAYIFAQLTFISICILRNLFPCQLLLYLARTICCLLFCPVLISFFFKDLIRLFYTQQYTTWNLPPFFSFLFSKHFVHWPDVSFASFNPHFAIAISFHFDLLSTKRWIFCDICLGSVWYLIMLYTLAALRCFFSVLLLHIWDVGQKLMSSFKQNLRKDKMILSFHNSICSDEKWFCNITMMQSTYYMRYLSSSRFKGLYY